VAGWSFGGRRRVNCTRDLNKVGERVGWSPGVAGYLLEDKVKVQDLMTWDPVTYGSSRA
jgi:hypothetical protein